MVGGISDPITRRRLLQASGAYVAATAMLAVGSGSGPQQALAQGATPAATPKRGGTLVFGHLGDVTNYDPLTSSLDLWQNYGRLMIYGALTAYDINLQLVGDLATSWKLDGTSWIFKLREGVTWHDGSPFTSDDVHIPGARTYQGATGR